MIHLLCVCGVGGSLFRWLARVRLHHCPCSHLERLQEGVEIDEDDLRDVVLPRIHEEEHVGDAQQR